MVADEMTVEEILADLPYLEREDIAEALRFAAEAVSDWFGVGGKDEGGNLAGGISIEIRQNVLVDVSCDRGRAVAQEIRQHSGRANRWPGGGYRLG